MDHLLRAFYRHLVEKYSPKNFGLVVLSMLSGCWNSLNSERSHSCGSAIMPYAAGWRRASFYRTETPAAFH